MVDAAASAGRHSSATRAAAAERPHPSGGGMRQCPSKSCTTYRWRNRPAELIDTETSCDVWGTKLVALSQPMALQEFEMLRCSSCPSSMAPLRRSGVMLDRCPSCAAIWFDTLELDRVLKSERRIREFLAFYDVPFQRDSEPSRI